MNTTTDRTKVEERVRKLLVQAEDSGATPEEAAGFAARAAELIARYDLDEAVVRAEEGQEPEGVELREFVVSGRGGHGRHRVYALVFIIQAYGCRVAVRGNDSRNAPRTMLVVGTVSALQALALLLPAFQLQMEQAATKAARMKAAGAPESKRAAVRRTFFRSFLIGWGAMVSQRIEESRGQIAEEVAGTTGALVLVSDADRVEAEYRRLFPNLAKRRALTWSKEGARAGVLAGQRADLGSGNVGVGGHRALDA